MTALPFDPLAQRAQRLGFHGLVAQWGALGSQPWVPSLLELEEAERTRRSLERRRQQARLKNFHPLADFDWGWPRRMDRAQVEDAFTLDFLKEAENIILLGPNGVGKTMIGHNLLHHALLRGHTVLCTTASAMLSDLAQRETAHALQVGFRRYARPQLLLIDEVGYLSYDNRHADLLFEVISRR
jgi:DNA replication protein DnaC